MPENIFRKRQTLKLSRDYVEEKLLRVRHSAQMSSAFVFFFHRALLRSRPERPLARGFQLFLDSELGTMLNPAGWNGPLIRRVLTKMCFEFSRAFAVRD